MWFFPCCNQRPSRTVGFMDVPPSVQLVDFSSPGVNTLSRLWQPLITCGPLQAQGYLAKPLFKTTTLDNVDTTELIAIATRIRRSETSSLEIGSSLLESEAVSNIQKEMDLTPLFPDQVVYMKVRKLLVVTPDNKNAHSIDQNEPFRNHVGVVEVILNYAYQGGELQVTSDERFTNLTTSPYSWVALHAEASSSIRPVLSGVRVSLIFDILFDPFSAKSMPTSMFIADNFDFTYHPLVRGIADCYIDKMDLTQIAEQLRPELVNKSQLTIDPCVLNTTTLGELGSKVNLSSLFGAKKVIAFAKHIVIDRAEGEACTSNPTIAEQHGVGSLGTLVLIMKFTSLHTSVHFRRGDTTAETRLFPKQWYAYKADTTATIGPVSCGSRVTIHYDICSAESSVVIHDPFPTGTEIPFVLTRSVVPESLSEQAQTVLATELASTDAVIITLQHLFPEGPTDELWNTYPSYLQGGDRVLYDILTDASFSEVYDVELVEVTISCDYDGRLQRNVIVPKQCTFTPCVDPLAAPIKRTQHGTVKLIVATKLIDRHRVNRYTQKNVYQMLSLYISKKI